MEPSAFLEKIVNIASKDRSTVKPSNLSLQDLVRLDGLRKYYTDNPDYFKLVCSIVDKTSPISLRCLDYLCTKFAYKHTVHFCRNAELINVFDVYENGIHTHGKEKLDAFRRSVKFEFDIDGTRLTTTVAQLAFFQMIKQAGIIDFAMKNISDIETEMSRDLKQDRLLKTTNSERTTSHESTKKNKRKRKLSVCLVRDTVEILFS